MEHILKAEDKILLGTERKSAIIPRTVQENTAYIIFIFYCYNKIRYHEAGHALLSTYFPGAQPVRSATIIPRGSVYYYYYYYKLVIRFSKSFTI